MAKLSVLMPCKNLTENCRRSIESILVQNVDLELIITVDGGRNSLEINDPRVIIKVLEKNLGPSAAANNCYKFATGDYITIHDDDDWSHPNRYEILLNEIGDNRAITSSINIFKKGRSYVKRFDPLRFIYPDKVKPPAHHCATIIRKDLWEELEQYDERLIVSDSVRMIRLGMYLLIKQEPFVVHDEPLYNYVVRRGSISRTRRWEREVNLTRFHLLNIYNECKENCSKFMYESKMEHIGFKI